MAATNFNQWSCFHCAMTQIGAQNQKPTIFSRRFGLFCILLVAGGLSFAGRLFLVAKKLTSHLHINRRQQLAGHQSLSRGVAVCCRWCGGWAWTWTCVCFGNKVSFLFVSAEKVPDRNLNLVGIDLPTLQIPPLALISGVLCGASLAFQSRGAAGDAFGFIILDDGYADDGPPCQSSTSGIWSGVCDMLRQQMLQDAIKHSMATAKRVRF